MMDNETSYLGRDLVESILDRLGLDEVPAPELNGLRAIYAAWCANVPFDNVRKMTALRTGDRLPGIRADEFFENWLRDGVGGTCWPTSNALYSLLVSLGFEARRVAGSMRDIGIINHGSVKVRIEDNDWLIDSSILCNTPLPLKDEVFSTGDPVFDVEVEPVGETYLVWTHTPPHEDHMPCRLLEDPAGPDLYSSRYEASREMSPFNQRLYARRNHPGRMVVLLGNTIFRKTAGEIESAVLTPRGLREALYEEIGLSGGLIERWVEAGCLEASFEPPSGPKPPPFQVRPPSKR